MKNNLKGILAVLFSLLFIGSCGFTIFYFGIRPDISITFIPSSSISYPGHVAWVLAEVDSTRPVKIELSTNTSLPVEYTIWNYGNTNYLVEIFLNPTQIYLNHEVELKVTTTSWNNMNFDNSTRIEIINWTLSIPEEILDMQKHFLHYIEENTTLANINTSTEWQCCGNVPQILVVEHYLFKSDYWEMELARHVMISPYDWVQVYIRPRNQRTPVWSAKLNSWTLTNTSIYEIEPPKEIFR